MCLGANVKLNGKELTLGEGDTVSSACRAGSGNDLVEDNPAVEDIMDDQVKTPVDDLRFRQLRGCTILDSICRARTAVIKRRLAETDDKIWQIAADCGFSSPERLAHFFRKHANASMRDWRKRHRA